MDIPPILSDRAVYSRVRLDELRKRMVTDSNIAVIDDLVVFCAGSYARLEASAHSDIDLFFVYAKDRRRGSTSRINELKLFSSLIDIADRMGFPAFSNDGQYLQTHECRKMLEHLGSPKDDAKNFFTMRMLMLLESRCLYGDDVYGSVQKEIIETYYRDYPDHQSSFEPWFLVNDIARYWKTLLLNYENKRRQPEEDQVQRTRQKVKNFKLKFSRMTTCFATIAALGSCSNPVEKERVHHIVQLTPQERLLFAAENVPAVEGAVADVLKTYAWFIEQTGKTEADLHSGFQDHESRAERFERANEYGDMMYKLITDISDAQEKAGTTKRLLRFLVI